MNSNETVVVVVLILATVIVVALFKFTDLRARIGKLFEIIGRTKRRPARQPSSPEVRIRKRQGAQPWLYRHWRGVLIGSSILLIIVVPVWWWAEQPAPWRMLLS